MSGNVQISADHDSSKDTAKDKQSLPRVSVVIPAYNQAHYLGDAIQSVLDQTFRDFEIIVVDDGSTDDTPLVAQQFADYINYIHQDNKGLSGARNTAIRHASAEIIALLDSDDMWEPEFLEKTIRLFENHPEAGAVYCGFKWIDAQGEVVGNPNVRTVSPELFHRTLICEGNWLVPCAVLFRKHLAEEVGLFDESLRAVEDGDLWIKLSVNHPFVGLPEALVKYRRHDSNMTKDPHHMMAAIHQRTENIFGPPVGTASSWSELKRCAYKRLYLSGTSRYLAYGDVEKSARYLEQLFEISPELILSMQLWRRLFRAYLPLEHRNIPSKELNWDLVQRNIMELLRTLSVRTESSITLKKNIAKIKGSAFLAFAEEARRAEKTKQPFIWLGRTLVSYPLLLLSRPYWGTVIRTLIRLESSNRK